MAELQPQNPEQRAYVSIPLRVGAAALSHMHTTTQAMREGCAPEVALIEIDQNVFTLGGNAVRWAIGGASPANLIDPEEIDLERVERSIVEDSVTLVLDQDIFEAIHTTTGVMDTVFAPKVALVQFGPVYRLGGDTVADYVESQGTRAIWGSNIDSQGHNATGENSYN